MSTGQAGMSTEKFGMSTGKSGMSRALLLTIGVWLLCFGLTILLEFVGQGGFIPSFAGAALVTIGVASGVGGMVAPGLLLLALGAVIGTRGVDPLTELVVLAITGVVCAICIQLASMSFLTRRENRLSNEVQRGVWTSTAMAAAVAFVASLLVIGAVDSIRWPAWLLPIPLSAIAVGAVWLALGAIRERRAAAGHIGGPGSRPPIGGSGPSAQPPPPKAASTPAPGTFRP